MLKKLFFFLVLLNTAFSSAQFNNYTTGDIINNFTVTDTDGQTYTLYDLLNQGKYVYIDFFATNCGTCQTKMPVFNAFYDKYGCNAGDVFCISIEVAGHNNAEVISFEQQYGGSSNHAPAVSADGGATAIVNDFGITSFPIICGIDPQKKLFIDNVRPANTVSDIAQSFPNGFNPPVMTCSNAIEQNNLLNIQIYPNPTRNFLTINNISVTKQLEINIYSMNGSRIWHQIFIKPKNNLSLNFNFENGVYILEIIDDKYGIKKELIIVN